MTGAERSSARKRRKAKRPAMYSDDFKKEAIAAGKESDNVAQTARDLGVSCSTLYRWLSQARRGKRKKRVSRHASSTAALTTSRGSLVIVAPEPHLPSPLLRTPRPNP